MVERRRRCNGTGTTEKSESLQRIFLCASPRVREKISRIESIQNPKTRILDRCGSIAHDCSFIIQLPLVCRTADNAIVGIIPEIRERVCMNVGLSLLSSFHHSTAIRFLQNGQRHLLGIRCRTCGCRQVS